MSIRGYGFFPGARAPRVFWVGIEGGPKLTSLAAAVDEKLAGLHIPKEEHAFTPHLTLARGAGGSGSPRKQKGDHPNRSFQHLQEKLAALPGARFRRDDGSRVFSVPEPALCRWIKVYEAGEFRFAVAVSLQRKTTWLCEYS